MAARYEIIDLRDGAVLRLGTDRMAMLQAVKEFVTPDRGRDQIDVVEIDGDHRRSLMLRGHESGVRSMMAAAEGREYVAFRSLDEARRGVDAVVIIEGDWGGQIHLTAPIAAVRTSAERLLRLATELEAITWPGNDRIQGSVSVLFEPLRPGAHVAGGMGGGHVTEDVWVHEELHQLGLAEAVLEIIHGKKEELPPPRAQISNELRQQVVAVWHDRSVRYPFQVLPAPPGYSRLYPRVIDLVAAEEGLRPR